MDRAHHAGQQWRLEGGHYSDFIMAAPHRRDSIRTSKGRWNRPKISHLFSYPIGASALSEGLRSTAQFGKLKVTFTFGLSCGCETAIMSF
jgi:hypothetical protein